MIDKKAKSCKLSFQTESQLTSGKLNQIKQETQKTKMTLELWETEIVSLNNTLFDAINRTSREQGLFEELPHRIILLIDLGRLIRSEYS